MLAMSRERKARSIIERVATQKSAGRRRCALKSCLAAISKLGDSIKLVIPIWAHSLCVVGLRVRSISRVDLPTEYFNEFVISFIALVASGRATDWPDGIRTHWRSPTFTACWVYDTIALSYVAGGFVPLAPYFFLGTVHRALIAFVIVTLLALLVFGYIKGMFTTARPLRNALQTVVVGGLAAAAAFAFAKAIS
jgi:VIT family